MNFLTRKQKNLLNNLNFGLPKPLRLFIIGNILFIVLQVIYTFLRFEFINEQIPLLYSNNWGEGQLVDKAYIYAIPAIQALLLPLALVFYNLAEKYFFRYGNKLSLIAVSITNIVLCVALIRIIFIASTPFTTPLIAPETMLLLVPFATSLAASMLITPIFIKYFNTKGIVTIPSLHKHPSMILTSPSARGGGLIFAIVFLLASITFVGFSKLFFGIYLGVALYALMGIFDDIQNTNPRSRYKFLEAPHLRLGLLFLIAAIPVLMGIRIDSINNPFNGTIYFTDYTLNLMGYEIYWVAIGFTVLWIAWVVNALSWSNGVDGQYGGIVTVACIVIAALALRYDVLEPIHINTAKMAIIAAGASIGITRYNWYPSRIMWGFGALTAGLIIATTSIVIEGKVGTSIMIILIPFIDGVVTVVRRILSGKNPLKGDKGHLHHILMNKGWGVRRISVFYWLTTTLFGLLLIAYAGSDKFLFVMTLIGATASALMLLYITTRSGFRSKWLKIKEN